MTANPPKTEPSGSSSSVETFLVDIRQLNAINWKAFRKHLDAAIERSNGDSDGDQTLIDILQGRAQLWGLLDLETSLAMGAIVTRIVPFGSGRARLTIQLAGGSGLSFDDMRAAEAVLERFARANGCEAIRIYGRKGWAKVLPGYGQPFVVHEKRLGDSAHVEPG